MPTSKPRRRPAAPRLLCSAETLAAVEAALPAVIGASGQMISKTRLVDAIVAVGLAHMDEVVTYVTPPADGPCRHELTSENTPDEATAERPADDVNGDDS